METFYFFILQKASHWWTSQGLNTPGALRRCWVHHDESIFGQSLRHNVNNCLGESFPDALGVNKPLRVELSLQVFQLRLGQSVGTGSGRSTF